MKKLINLLSFIALYSPFAFAASGSAGTGSFLDTLNTVKGWVFSGSSVIMIILVVIGGVKIANGDEKASSAGGRYLIAGIFIGCAGWFVSQLIPY